LKPKTTVTKLEISEEQRAEVKKIQTRFIITKKRDDIRTVLGGISLCCVDEKIPDYLVTYNMDGIVRRESYCEKCYNDIYLNQIDLTNDTAVADRYGCVKDPNQC
jgi:uncharacterized protein with PIN domain